jgi:hypothetical protein
MSLPVDFAGCDPPQGRDPRAENRVGKTTPLTLYLQWRLDGAADRRGAVRVRHGYVRRIRCRSGEAQVVGETVVLKGGEPVMLELDLEVSSARYGRKVAILRWEAEEEGFSFLPLAVPERDRIHISGIPVCISRDLRSMESAEDRTLAVSTDSAAVFARGDDPRGREIGWKQWAERTAAPAPVPTVLGLSRDQRLFVVDVFLEGSVRASLDLMVPTLVFDLGMVSSAQGQAGRSLEDGYMPILCARQRVGRIEIERTFSLLTAIGR